MKRVLPSSISLLSMNMLSQKKPLNVGIADLTHTHVHQNAKITSYDRIETYRQTT